MTLSAYKYIPYVIGSFFMFRTISFLHEIKFMKKEVNRIDSINYFLLTPNFSLPLFPIVDYKSFINSYEGINYNTLKRGSLFICRGLFQMILYRYIYHEIIIPFNQIHTISEVILYLVANFMIVLRVIGAFHIAIGLVIITGYNIPDIFNNIFFSTGFSDLWRRTNMYWRNFMIKIFYYPIYFKIKKIGTYNALFLATFVSFFITWLLHTYQWFWIKGSFPVDMKDAIFWGSFGLLVGTNTLLQQKELDRKIHVKDSPFQFLRQALAGLIVLFIMSLLWSIWTCNSLSEWWKLIQISKNADFQQLYILARLSLLYLLAASIYHYYQKHKLNKFVFFEKNMTAIAYSGFILLFSALLFLHQYMQKNHRMFFRMRMEPVLSEQLNKADLLLIDNGYYTNLISTNNYCSQVWTIGDDISRDWTKYITEKTTKPSNDLMLTENIPNAKVKHKNITYTLNADGLRDKVYPKIKPDSCYRIIVLGGSYECGNGINDGDDFISQVEKDLNEKYIATINGERKHIEIINFSSNGYRLMQRLYQYKTNARYWNADALFLFIHTNYHVRIINYINRLVYQGFEINDPYLKHIVEMKHITKEDDGPQVLTKLGSYADSINYYAVSSINEIARKDSTKLIAVFLPEIRQQGSKKDSIFMDYICRNYNILPISMADVFNNHNYNDLALSVVDFHPNYKATKLITDKLLDNIISNQDYFNIQFTKK